MLIRQLDDYWEITNNSDIRGGGSASVDVGAKAKQDEATGFSDSEAKGEVLAVTTGAVKLRVDDASTRAFAQGSARFVDKNGKRRVVRDYERDFRTR